MRAAKQIITDNLRSRPIKHRLQDTMWKQFDSYFHVTYNMIWFQNNWLVIILLLLLFIKNVV